jgi:cob(I)alamin adenosyltransferase
MTDDATAAMRYKEIIALSRGSADRLREWELARVDELESEIEEARTAIEAATERERHAAERATRWWKMALHNIQGLTWLAPGDEPQPVPTARAAYLERYLQEVKPSYQELVQAVLGLGWRAKRAAAKRGEQPPPA